MFGANKKKNESLINSGVSTIKISDCVTRIFIQSPESFFIGPKHGTYIRVFTPQMALLGVAPTIVLHLSEGPHRTHL